MRRKDFDIEKFKEEKIAIHCRTEEEVKDLFDFMGWDTTGGTKFRVYESKTCYNCDKITENWKYCSEEHYRSENYKILEWSDYMNNTPKDLIKDGMIVEVFDTDSQISTQRFVFDNILIGEKNWGSLEFYDNNLVNQICNTLKVNRIYQPKNYNCVFSSLFKVENHTLIWERPKEEPKEKNILTDLSNVSIEDLLAEVQKRMEDK